VHEFYIYKTNLVGNAEHEWGKDAACLLFGKQASFRIQMQTGAFDAAN